MKLQDHTHNFAIDYPQICRQQQQEGMDRKKRKGTKKHKALTMERKSPDTPNLIKLKAKAADRNKKREATDQLQHMKKFKALRVQHNTQPVNAPEPVKDLLAESSLAIPVELAQALLLDTYVFMPVADSDDDETTQTTEASQTTTTTMPPHIESFQYLPQGNGTKASPIYFAVNIAAPELNHGFCCLKFPNMTCPAAGEIRDIVEISHEASWCDLQGDWQWKAFVPEDVPQDLEGRVLHIMKPSLSMIHRHPSYWTERTRLTCKNVNIARREAIDAVIDSVDRHYTHYRAVFPFEIDHQVFNDPAVDHHHQVRRFPVSLLFDETHDSNPTKDPLKLLMVSWRIGQKGGGKPDKQPEKIDMDSLLN